MSVEILNEASYDGHAAQIEAAVAIAQHHGWSEPDGQSAVMETIASKPVPEFDTQAAPKPDSPDFDL